ncbi:MAG: DNA polymerase III subunit alpha [Rikenellaceae bacterium]|nr:DNA polymerase III subunit alpha [Rikenellaceae bacterium]
MPQFVHLHVHSQYSILDGQASIQRLVDKAAADGQPGIALTDHGSMFGVKEFTNYVKKFKGKCKDGIAAAEAEIAKIRSGEQETATPDGDIKKLEQKIAELKRKAAFKPIIGCEVYVARRTLYDKEGKQDQSGYHLVLLAKNLKGYHNLIKIVSKAWTEGFYMRPRTDRTEIEKYHEGLICCSACLAGEVPRAITADELEKADEAVRWYKNLFGDDFYLELQLHRATVERANHEAYGMQLKVNDGLRDLAAKHRVKLICTNDVHFVDEDDAEAHDRLICLSTGKDLDDPKRMLYSKQEWLKSYDEMAAIFGESDPEALATTVEICDKVELYSIDNPPIMPNFDIPADFGTEEGYRQKYSEKDLFDEFTQDENGNVVLSEEAAKKKIEKLGGYDKLYRIKFEADYLGFLTMQGAKKRYGEPLSEEVMERLKFELHIMKTMGFPGYFLIVQDFIRAAREELDVSVGPGRGSAAGSAVAYCLGITQIDPIAYDLLFERFLNPDRISLPDIDVDFDDDGRGRVLNWVTEKYGKEKVAHIITYGTMATKLSIKDVARVQKLPLPESDRLCKLVPDKTPDGGRVKNLVHAISLVPELKAAEESEDPVLHDTIQYAKKLEGNVRNTGVHACGTIICRDDITDWVPVSTADDKETGEKMLVTQYEGSVIEDTGLIKMDFLGLKTLSILKDAVANIRQTKGIEVDIDDFSIITDRPTYDLYCEGRTVGTFQFESPGMQKYLRELQPSTFEDLIAMNALYRPGPMDNIPDFIARKHGRSPIVYDIPIMERYLKDTYGITVYQEQVMLLSRLLGSFTRGESDTLRKAMGKKIKSKLDELKPEFLKRGAANGHDVEVLEKIWGEWEKFASYAFNKSHATCYSWVAFQTAYLKANYPSEYMAAVLSRNLANVAQLTIYMNECKRMGIRVLGSDVNESMKAFSANQQGDIRFGMAAIKGMGEAAAESIIREREENGPFKNIYDFFERVNYSVVNRKAIENLAYAGAFSSIADFHRSKFFAPDVRDTSGGSFLEALIRYGQRVQQEKNNAQQSLFGGFGAVDIQPPTVPSCYDWSQLETLNKEREMMGLYLTAHPLDEYKFIIENMCQTQLSQLEDLQALKDKEICVAGLVVAAQQELVTRTGRNFGKLTLEDYNSQFEFAFFGKDYENFRKFLYPNYYLMIRCKVQPRPYQKEGEEERLELKVLQITQLQEVRETMIRDLHLRLPIEELTERFVADLATIVKKNKGKTTLRIYCYDRTGVAIRLFSKRYQVELSQELVEFLEQNEIQFTIS